MSSLERSWWQWVAYWFHILGLTTLGQSVLGVADDIERERNRERARLPVVEREHE